MTLAELRAFVEQQPVTRANRKWRVKLKRRLRAAFWIDPTWCVVHVSKWWLADPDLPQLSFAIAGWSVVYDNYIEGHGKWGVFVDSKIYVLVCIGVMIAALVGWLPRQLSGQALVFSLVLSWVSTRESKRKLGPYMANDEFFKRLLLASKDVERTRGYYLMYDPSPEELESFDALVRAMGWEVPEPEPWYGEDEEE